ncbi:hypothetical protein LTR37_019779 [Vermiconidia calcicola]|uniref:Uncharacterized protein n=1 Tax=Vermiconidia calcicola TaxID=1690605 RepID=A0ACC3MD31_9PEZI|nr:hypothetical protein LTR37_019779 [Vermiconidia calcicola]
MAPPSKPDSFPSSDKFDTLVSIQIGTGEGQRTFEVFKGVFCFYSGYFTAALDGRFIEGREGVVKLPTEDPVVFELFRHWIHTRCFFESTLAPEILLSFDMIGKLWIFGDAHDIQMLQNVVADILVAKVWDRQFPSAEVVSYILENTAEGSHLRRLLMELAKPTNIDDTKADSTNIQKPEDIVTAFERLAIRYGSRRHGTGGHTPAFRRKMASKWWQCKWHVHRDGVTCFTEETCSGGER